MLHDVTPSSKCSKLLKSRLQGSSLDLTQTGSPLLNDAVKYLDCEVRDNKQCMEARDVYYTCHKSIMGVGVFEKRSNCESEMAEWMKCIKAVKAAAQNV